MLRFRVGPQAEGILLLRPGVAEMQELPVVSAHTPVLRRHPGALSVVVIVAEQLPVRCPSPHCRIVLALPLDSSLSLVTPLATIATLWFPLATRLAVAALLS